MGQTTTHQKDSYKVRRILTRGQQARLLLPPILRIYVQTLLYAQYLPPSLPDPFPTRFQCLVQTKSRQTEHPATIQPKAAMPVRQWQRRLDRLCPRTQPDRISLELAQGQPFGQLRSSRRRASGRRRPALGSRGAEKTAAPPFFHPPQPPIFTTQIGLILMQISIALVSPSSGRVATLLRLRLSG